MIVYLYIIGYCNDEKRQNISLPVDNVSQVQYRLEMPAETAERCNIAMDDHVYLYLNSNEMNVRFVVTIIIETHYYYF